MNQRHSIAGRLDTTALAALAGHAPQASDRDTARVAARELRTRGLTPRDIAAALKLSESAVRQLLDEPEQRA